MMNSLVFNTAFRFPFQSGTIKLILAVVVACAAVAPVRAKEDLKALDGVARQQYKTAHKLYRKGKTADAAAILREILQRYPENPTTSVKLAQFELKLKNLGAAYDLSYGVALRDPKNADAYAVLGATLLNGGRFEDAGKMLNIALNLDDQQPLAWAALGMLNFYENRIEYSINALEHAVFNDPLEPDYIFALAQVRSRGERYREAALAYEIFLNISPETDKDRRDRIKGLINFLRFLGGKMRLYEVGGGEKSTVSVELVRDRPVIELRINRNDEPLRFVLDTGSGISVISRTTAERLKVKPVTRGGLARAIGGTGTFPIVYGFLDRVRIGQVEVSSVPVYIRDFHVNDEEIDGYIGLSLISKFLTTLDYGDRTFTLLRKDTDEAKAIGQSGGRFLPLRLTSSGFLSGEVQLEGLDSSLNFIVDTGASISVISNTVARNEGISRYELEEKMRVVGAAGVTENVSSFQLPKVSFGDNSLERITAIALDLDLINEASGFTQAGILGGNFLKNYRLTFDFKNSKVIFTPVK